MSARVTFSELRPEWHDTGKILMDKALQTMNEDGGSESIPTLAAPTNLTIEGLGVFSVDLSWEDNSEAELSFEIWRKTGAGLYDSIQSAPAEATTFVDNTASPSTTYTYKVRAHGEIVDSDFSNEAVALTQDEG